MSSGPEKERGLDWAKLMKQRGAWVQKLPASVLAGVPDYVIAEPGRGLRVCEAKAALEGASCFRPRQCSGAQRLFLNAVTRFAGPEYATVLILGDTCWLEVTWASVRRRRSLSTKVLLRDGEAY